VRHRNLAGGSITCELLRSPTPAKRLVRLVAQYFDAGILTTHVVQCDSETEEVSQLSASSASSARPRVARP
jgi:hypothetical protein